MGRGDIARGVQGRLVRGARPDWIVRLVTAALVTGACLPGGAVWGQEADSLATTASEIALPASIATPAATLSAMRSLDLTQPSTTTRVDLSARPKPLSLPEEPSGPVLPFVDQTPTVPAPFEPEWRTSRRNLSRSLPRRVAEAEDERESPLELARPEKQGQRSELEESELEEKVDPETKKAPVEESTESQESRHSENDAETKETPKPAAKPLQPLSRNQRQLRNKLRKVLTYYYRQPLNSREHDAWEAMHGMLAYGLKSRIRGGRNGKTTTSIGWLCYNNPCKRKQLLRLNEEGEIRAQYGVGLQGHMGQFLAMLAQCNLGREYPIRVSGREFTVEDLITSEQQTCYPNTELTFKLIGLMHYLPSDSEWVNDRGENWSITRLIEEELKQPIRGVACGGTHRLGGLSLAVRKRAERGEPIDGAFLKAAQFTRRYERYAFHLQNSDGSFSTEWFRGPGRESDINRRVRTTGHLLEWLIYQVSDEHLESYRVVKGVNYLTNLLYQNTRNEWEVGPISHALHALALYDQRIFKPHDVVGPLAAGPKSRATSRSPASRRR